jgi:hypothetical protein
VVIRRCHQEAAGGLAGIRSVGSSGRQAINFMLNALLRNVSIRESLESPAMAGRVFNQSTTTTNNVPHRGIYF